ncbi:MAG: methionine--tRNA ligase [Candidatus Pacebacteria bacterium]|nr:methionine--tRNA ligase [Candidatus Paceibacterota bacterium]
MSDKKAKYITTTLPYVNSDPHIGHAYEFLQADVLARYYRLLGHEVFFNTGTDEHGQKLAQKADEKGESRQAYVDHYANEFKKLGLVLNLSYDNFIRTTDEAHKLAAEEIWRRCAKKGDIYKKKYSGLYCVGCEAFKTESDLVDGKCPDHNTSPELIEEENYFFKLSNYQEYLEEYLSHEELTLPDWRRLETLNFVKTGLSDLSISREKSRLDWGVPVPDDSEQVMYVWFDALTNYISTLGWPNEAGNFKKFWVDGETLQLAGKDQMRFQSVIWQAMLKSANIKATDKIVYHGFINSDGQKMSKSLGNVISPYELIERYGTDATRYLLLRHVHPFDDTDVTWEKLDEWYTANLVNGLGNLVARVMKMAETHLDEPVTRPESGAFGEEYLNAIENYNLQLAGDFIWQKIGALDERIAVEQPFKVVKENKSKAEQMIREMVIEVYLIGRLLNPFLPETSKIIKQSVLENKKPENLFGRLEN